MRENIERSIKAELIRARFWGIKMDEDDIQVLRFFSLGGRIGRLRYLAYGVGVVLLTVVPVIVGYVLVLHGFHALGVALLFICYAFAFVMDVIIPIRRLHDADLSGWWYLLMFVPLVNLGLILYLIFKPGTDSDNRFGAPPPPNSSWVIAGVWTYPALFILGITASSYLPSFGAHLITNRVTQGMQILPGVESQMLAYHKANGNWPNSSNEIALPALPANSEVKSIDIASDSSIHLVYDRPPQLSGRSLYMTPNIGSDGTVNWVCTTNIPQQYLTKQMAAQCWPMAE
ncbi:MAG: DUF805 domain-containing protein [Gammaproteobacteria bacterium]